MSETFTSLDGIRTGQLGTADHLDWRDLGYPLMWSSHFADEQTEPWRGRWVTLRPVASRGRAGTRTQAFWFQADVVPICCGKGGHPATQTAM